MGEWFTAVISQEDQYEVARAQLAVDLRFEVACKVALMMPELIREKFGEDPFEGMRKVA